MKKCDLHIHTISTITDHPFTFNMDVLKDYVQKKSLDVIAITNHNVFDRKQFEDIVLNLPSITVLPGIEIDLEGGHVIFLADNTSESLVDFNIKCANITPLITNQTDTIDFNTISKIFVDFSKYLIIPHYDKDPSLQKETIAKFGRDIFAGEVSSLKKFIHSLKSTDLITPVLFSDFRAETGATDASYPNRYTYLDIREVTINTLKVCLRDKSKVGLAPTDGHKIFQCLSDGTCLSTGLNIVLGKRSSGKTYTLDHIANYFGGNVLYIKQFELTQSQNTSSLEQFDKEDKIKQEKISEKYLESFKSVVDDIVSTPILKAEIQERETYLQALIKFAKEENISDIYSKAKLFNSATISLFKLESLEKLISATKLLIEDCEYRSIIDANINISDLKKLYCQLVDEYREKSKANKMIFYVNTIIEEVNRSLQLKTVATRIPNINLTNMFINSCKRERFIEVVDLIKKERIIDSRKVGSFTIQTSSRPFNNATDMKQGPRVSLTTAYNCYRSPLVFLEELKNTTLDSSTFYKYFAKIEYRILNSLGQNVSGGERTEFNFLAKVRDAMQYDALIIDEPESSFDNIFLKTEVNSLIKEMAQSMPVIVSTHNSTIGGSIKPDYIVYTEKQIINNKSNFKVYTGYPDEHDLKSIDGSTIQNYKITIDSLEAGEVAYDDRSQHYEILKN